MLRLLVSGLLLSTVRRPVAAAHTTHNTALHSRALTAAATCRNYNHNYNGMMEQPFERMAEEGVPKCDKPTKVSAPKKEDQDLPKLSPQEFRVYNRMAEHMDMFHENFRRTWNLLHGACTSGKRPSGMSLRAFLNTGLEFCHHLTVHHTIEEQHIFPVLARKMPAFQKELELLTQHKQIHAGLEKFEEYLDQCRSGERELRLEEMGKVLETFGTVLWSHLDDEVRQLRAENMRRFWSAEEMRRLPM
ncbi:hypothetical protein B0A55_00691 [Friedmanniomyces simplex]|uniref:Hemerythrin-like domain-containing protein n=1 Tax=Friedmanniomyces simplex TaxID=329884 RepID=A0A4U0XZA0_9PEZI|nr:hypothetical protein B0A55_00691 [Friedmanniomyces simplex]